MPIKFPSGVFYVRTITGLVQSLFHPVDGKTASGTYRVKCNGVLFMDAKGKPEFFLVANPGQSQFFVSCERLATGKICYAFAISSKTEEKLGISSHKLASELAESVWEQTKGAAPCLNN